jgi:hypothetical protein
MEFVHDNCARDTGGEELQSLPNQEKPTTELGRLAEHDVLLGDLFMELYNRHRHPSLPPELLLNEQSTESDRRVENDILLGDLFMKLYNQHRHA